MVCISETDGCSGKDLVGSAVEILLVGRVTSFSAREAGRVDEALKLIEILLSLLANIVEPRGSEIDASGQINQLAVQDDVQVSPPR